LLLKKSLKKGICANENEYVVGEAYKKERRDEGSKAPSALRAQRPPLLWFDP
jgi:hypothetical protein